MPTKAKKERDVATDTSDRPSRVGKYPSIFDLTDNLPPAEQIAQAAEHLADRYPPYVQGLRSVVSPDGTLADDHAVHWMFVFERLERDRIKLYRLACQELPEAVIQKLDAIARLGAYGYSTWLHGNDDLLRRIVQEAKYLSKAAMTSAPPSDADEGEWSKPMPKKLLRSRLDLEPRAFETFAKLYGLKRISRQQWQIRLDKMDARTRERIETGK